MKKLKDEGYTLLMPVALKRRVQKACRQLGVSMSAFVKFAITEKLEREEK